MYRGLASIVLIAPSLFAADEKKTTAPELPKKATWIQSDPLQFKDLKGEVVVVHFWTFGCVNCQQNYPVYKSWQEKYADKKLKIIGVHTPEFAAEKNIDRIKEKAKENGLKFPIVVDNDKAIWKAWKNQYWPAIYLVDKKGTVRHRWIGELHIELPNDKKFAERIDELLAEKD